MSDYEVEKLGRTMAGILRHGKFDLDMDDQGFVDMRDIVAVMKSKNPRMKWLRTHHIEAMVETDPKGRYQISGSDVRATYGHTIELSLRLPIDDIPEVLFYPTTEEECATILEAGLFPSDRAMVHLSRTYSDAVKAGSVRADNPGDRYRRLHRCRHRDRKGRKDRVSLRPGPFRVHVYSRRGRRLRGR